MLLDQILLHVPCPIFWKDLNGIFLGCNNLFLTISKFHDYSQLIGKSDKELPWAAYADDYYEDDQYVIQAAKSITRIENIPLPDRVIVSETTKTPLMQDNKIIGVLGICLDITDRKKAESEKEEFFKIVAQVAHDIRSPLASLLMIIKACEKDMPEQARIILREAATNIGDIANNLLAKYKKEELELQNGIEKAQPILVSLSLLQVLTDKKYQYQNLPVRFQHEFSDPTHFAFIYVEPIAFKRMLSNLINNAVDALEGKDGDIKIRLDIQGKDTKVVIHDTGHGMSTEVINNILNAVVISSNKKDGYGIGLAQVRETLERNQGKLSIDSEIGKGTTFTLTFPNVDPPDWIAEKIELTEGDRVVILDDDTSIHGAWKTRFKPYDIPLHHFHLGEEAIKFIQAFPDKNKLFLLTDFELLKQELHGLDVIERTQIPRSILVTSHYAHQKVRMLATQTGTKILPKQLASEIPIYFEEKTVVEISQTADIVFIDDNERFLQTLTFCFNDNIVLDTYSDPDSFLENLHKYNKDTPIVTDHDMHHRLDGFDLAKVLHEAGYKKLYLYSGRDFEPSQIPDYLTVLSKGDSDAFSKIAL